MAGLPTKAQIAKLKATGKVADVEDEGMDEGRFFVHLEAPYSWNDGYGHQETKSFGNYREAMSAVKKVKEN
jgi:hypothetical protein